MAITELFIPFSATVHPSMLMQIGEAKTPFPFSSPNIRYYYFARNAIWQTVKRLGLDKGEVLAPAYHHGIEIDALLAGGAQVKFYRLGLKWEVDLEDVEKKINTNTTALYLTHFNGFPGPVHEMRRLADKYQLPLIEDCALALLSRNNDDMPLGLSGDISIFCIYKFIPVPNGGAMVINNPDYRNIAEPPPPPFSSTLSVLSSSLLRNFALRGGRAGRRLRKLFLGLGKKILRVSRIEPIMFGTQNLNPDHLNLGISSLSKHIVQAQNYSQISAKRRRNYLFLLEHLREISAPLFDHLPTGVVPLYYPFLVDDNRTMVERLEAQGIEAVAVWPSFHPNCDPAEFSEVARLRKTILELPCHQDLTLEKMATIVTAVRTAVRY
ncbi:MAG: DegT/DnrJ/EryC1/StrS family aminotransferase [Acidobacteriota bacterium]